MVERKPKEQHCMQAAFLPFPPKDVRAGRLVVELLTEEVCHAYARSSYNEFIDALELGHPRPEICHAGAKGI